MKNPRICRKCILPENKPDIFLDADDICNICNGHEKAKRLASHVKPVESDLLKIINKHKGKHKYDCLVMCSGGKDSTSSLYYMKRRYKLNPLAFTFDHGFETDEALDNVKNAVDILEVDLLFFRTDFMKEMFSKILNTESGAVICHLCSIWYMELAFDTAARYDIPLIVAGWTKGQSTRQDETSKYRCNLHNAEFGAMAQSTRDFLSNELKDIPRYKDFPKSMEEGLKRAKKKHKATVISPHWFLPFGPEVYIETIKSELNWKAPETSYPEGTTNCLLNFISAHNSMKHFGYTHYHVEASKLIREGYLGREEALKQLEITFDKAFLNRIARKLDFKFE
ncbi:MAG: 7-cyano-7-deazaguanine synthase [Bacteroidetes bacterium]|nr:7-cyano-7-deazaguanine synthase [Bacteroidota bacterium]